MTADVLRSTRSALPGLIAKEGVTCVVEVKSVRDTCRQLADTPMSFRALDYEPEANGERAWHSKRP